MYAVKGWNDFQHYRDRNPPWVKLHKKFLDDFDFHSLPVASRALAPLLWLLASEHKTPQSGYIEGPASRISFRLHMTILEFDEAINPLIEKGFILDGDNASNALARSEQSAVPETETETEIRVQRHNKGFEKKGEGYARKKPSGTDQGLTIAEEIRSGRMVI